MKPIEKQNAGTQSVQKNLEFKSIRLRRMILQMIFRTKAGHTGGSLSCIDLLNVLYNHTMTVTPENFTGIDRDHYIHSKGHSVEALYAVLAEKGYFSEDLLNSVETFGSEFIGHPTRRVFGIEQNTGALGHGLSVAVGMALAAKMDERRNRVFVILGDGEITEGSNWEAAASAAHYHLDNLIAIVDRNTLQITGRTESVMAMEPLEEKLLSFGFAVRPVDGNGIADIMEVMSQLPFERGKPNAILAHTVKGKGISYMEDNVLWHHRVPTDAEFGTAMRELDLAEGLLEQKYGQR